MTRRWSQQSLILPVVGTAATSTRFRCVRSGTGRHISVSAKHRRAASPPLPTNCAKPSMLTCVTVCSTPPSVAASLSRRLPIPMPARVITPRNTFWMSSKPVRYETIKTPCAQLLAGGIAGIAYDRTQKHDSVLCFHCADDSLQRPVSFFPKRDSCGGASDRVRDCDLRSLAGNLLCLVVLHSSGEWRLAGGQ